MTEHGGSASGDPPVVRRRGRLRPRRAGRTAAAPVAGHGLAPIVEEGADAGRVAGRALAADQGKEDDRIGSVELPVARAGWAEPVRHHLVLVIMGCAAATGFIVWRIGTRPELPAFLYLGVVGILLSVIDVVLQRLPDPLTLASYGVGATLLGVAALCSDEGGQRFVHALVGLAALWALFAVQWLGAPGAIGLGDVKLAGVLGLYLGWLGLRSWIVGVVAMFVLGALIAIALVATRRADRKTSIPFGPFMIAGTMIAVMLQH